MIKDNKFDSEILDTIKEKKIKPKSKLTFLLKDYVVWAFGFLSLIFGSIAVSLIIYLVKNNDWDVYTELSGSLLEFVLLTMPYFWIVFLLVFILVINYNIKHTKKGYKFSLPVILSSSMFASILLGTLFFNLGLGQALDDVLGEKVSFYDTIINPRMRIWNNPESGRLVGMIIEKVSKDEFKLLDRQEKEWLINIMNAKTPIEAEMECGCPVKLTGEMEKENYFIVEQVFIHNGPGRGMLKHHFDSHIPFDIERHNRMMKIINK